MSDPRWSGWDYMEDVDVAGADPIGYTVVARDGDLGVVSDAAFTTGSSWILVDTRHWIIGKHVLLPAGVVRAVDSAARQVLVDLSKGDIKNAPASPPPEESASRREELARAYDELAEYYAELHGAFFTPGVLPSAYERGKDAR
jgi:hypothetical protein